METGKEYFGGKSGTRSEGHEAPADHVSEELAPTVEPDGNQGAFKRAAAQVKGVGEKLDTARRAAKP